jgi:serine/threonine-protein kinase
MEMERVDSDYGQHSSALIRDRYRLTRCIGEGAMGKVFAAVQEPLGRTVAIKFLRSDIPLQKYGWAVERFHHEARVLASLNHPNIVTLYDYGRTEDGRLFMVMECLAGTTLEEVLLSGEMNTERSCRLFKQLLAGLSVAHRSGLVHRDLKPANVIVYRDRLGLECLKILDFGLSTFLDRSSQGPVELLVGSLGYMAPEHLQGMGVDARSDIYSVGVMMYQSLSGTLPFHADTAADWFHCHQQGSAPELATRCSDVPAPLCSLVSMAMSKTKEERYSSAEIMLAELDGLMTGSIAVDAERIQFLKYMVWMAFVGYIAVVWTTLIAVGR